MKASEVLMRCLGARNDDECTAPIGLDLPDRLRWTVLDYLDAAADDMFPYVCERRSWARPRYALVLARKWTPDIVPLALSMALSDEAGE